MPRRSVTRLAALVGLLFAASSVVAGGCASPAAPSVKGPASAAGSPPQPASPGSASPAPAATPREPRRITVAYPTSAVTMTGFYIAIQEGFTVDEGLDAELVLMNGTLAAQGMVAHQVDFGMSAGASLAAALRGAPLRLVFVQIDKPLYFLFTQPEIQTAAELEGKSVGIAAVGDSTQLATKATLKGLGANPEAISYVANITGAQSVAALQSASVSGAAVSAPFDLIAQRLGFRNLGFMGDYLDYLTSGLATREDHLQTQPDLVLATLRAEIKAHRYMQQNRLGTIAHLTRFLEISEEDATEAYDAYMRYLTLDGTSTPEVLERILRDQRSAFSEQGVETGTASVNDMFHLDLARRANAELDREGWRPRQ
jgi:NitT/TauT family transport system substrate-binding protein